MYIHRALLLVLLMMYVFTPSLQAWVLAADASWYRPWAVWLLIIAAIFWTTRRRQTHGL
ncbi:MAG TPA: hypothetical protein VIM96_07120 [Pseudomonadales bacterium]|jgi:hypothetical protein